MRGGSRCERRASAGSCGAAGAATVFFWPFVNTLRHDDTRRFVSPASQDGALRIPGKSRTVPGITCANGSATGFAVNIPTPSHNSNRLRLFLNGGGACWDAVNQRCSFRNPATNRAGNTAALGYNPNVDRFAVIMSNADYVLPSFLHLKRSAGILSATGDPALRRTVTRRSLGAARARSTVRLPCWMRTAPP